jgi:hypothetical protein
MDCTIVSQDGVYVILDAPISLEGFGHFSGTTLVLTPHSAFELVTSFGLSGVTGEEIIETHPGISNEISLISSLR